MGKDRDVIYSNLRRLPAILSSRLSHATTTRRAGWLLVAMAVMLARPVLAQTGGVAPSPPRSRVIDSTVPRGRSQTPEDRAREQEAYVISYVGCASDSLRARVARGSTPIEIGAEHSARYRERGREPEWRGSYHGCADVLRNRPNRYDSAAVRADVQRRLRDINESEGAKQLQQRVRRRMLTRPFGEYTWVFIADVILGAAAGAAAAMVRYGRGNISWNPAAVTLLGVVLGGLWGGFVFLPFVMMAAFFIFFRTTPELELFAMSAFAILFTMVPAFLRKRGQ